ncbi:MAG: hypothetical protein RLP44_00205 [Aggregatilineales bacterium]
MFNLLAHGGLGGWDEFIFVGVAVIFIIMMAISWVRSRNIEPEFDDERRPNMQDDDPASDHFKLN